MTATPTATCIDPPAGVVAWWPADATATDLSGNGNRGALHGGGAYPTGKVGSAFSLPTTADYFDFSNSPTLNFTGNFSIDAWIRTTNPVAGRATIVDRRVGTNTNPVGYHLFLYAGALAEPRVRQPEHSCDSNPDPDAPGLGDGYADAIGHAHEHLEGAADRLKKRNPLALVGARWTAPAQPPRGDRRPETSPVGGHGFLVLPARLSGAPDVDRGRV